MVDWSLEGRVSDDVCAYTINQWRKGGQMDVRARGSVSECMRSLVFCVRSEGVVYLVLLVCLYACLFIYLLACLLVFFLASRAYESKSSRIGVPERLLHLILFEKKIHACNVCLFRSVFQHVNLCYTTH